MSIRTSSLLSAFLILLLSLFIFNNHNAEAAPPAPKEQAKERPSDEQLVVIRVWAYFAGTKVQLRTPKGEMIEEKEVPKREAEDGGYKGPQEATFKILLRPGYYQITCDSRILEDALEITPKAYVYKRSCQEN